MKSKTSTGNDARQRIFEAAVSIIARRGFDAAGIRQIAKAAGVNIARINYYYGNKAGLLKAIIEEFTNRYYRGLQAGLIADLPARDGHRANIKAIVGVYRDDIELAIAADKVLWLDIPEVHAAQIHLHRAHRSDLDHWFKSMGLDPDNQPQMAVARGLITNLVAAHFTSRYHYEHIISLATRRALLGRGAKEVSARYDDDFYERYCSYLADLYMAGITALASSPSVGPKRRPARKKPAARRKP